MAMSLEQQKRVSDAKKQLELYLKTVKCGFCKKLMSEHTRFEIEYHFMMRDAYITKLRTIMEMTGDDRKKLVKFIKKHSTKADMKKLVITLRYTYDFPEFHDEIYKKIVSNWSKDV